MKCLSLYVNTITCAILLTGCGANFNSIYRSENGDGNQIIFTDAKQAATVVKVDRNGVMQACAAKSPDVFQALSTAFNGSLSVEEANQIAAKMAGAGSSSEAAASYRLHTQLTDTQNELLYQLCVNSLNGTLRPDQLATELHRYQNTMVTMLAIEQLTGYAKPSIVALGGGSAGTGSAKDLASIQASLDSARANESKLKTDFEQKKKIQDDKQTAYDTAKATSDAAPADKAKQDATTKANDELTAAKKDAASYKSAWTEATNNRTNLESVRDKALTETASGSQGATAQFGGALITPGADANAAATIANTIQEMQTTHLHQTFTTDECLSFLFHGNVGNSGLAPVDLPDLKQFCFNHLKEVNKFKFQTLYLASGCDIDGKNCSQSNIIDPNKQKKSVKTDVSDLYIFDGLKLPVYRPE
ncbi:hypothetical protein [Methylomonas sp. CM2]|uniref:hypothetical protein n=1 Tax=Methylomonas sp. CM2 TaxID=3417647 RepID=UPI003CE94CA6